MGGLNSLSGLNNVNVDFRPTVELIKSKPDKSNQPLPGANVVPENAPQPERAEAKSVVRQLDVLLLGAASKSVSADIATNVTTIGNKLVKKGVLTQKQLSKLESLAETAAAKLKALDKFSGRELATALPEEIDKEFYDKLMEMADPAKKQAYLDSIKSRVSHEALEATSARIDEAIAYAQKLNDGGKVYGKEQWRDWNKIVAMTGVKANVTITKVNDDKLKVGGDIEIVSDYNERNCPSFFKREYLHKMFNKPV